MMRKLKMDVARKCAINPGDLILSMGTSDDYADAVIIIILDCSIDY